MIVKKYKNLKEAKEIKGNLFRQADAARELNVSQTRINQLCKEERIKRIEIGKIKYVIETEINKYEKERRPVRIKKCLVIS